MIFNKESLLCSVVAVIFLIVIITGSKARADETLPFIITKPYSSQVINNQVTLNIPTEFSSENKDEFVSVEKQLRSLSNTIITINNEGVGGQMDMANDFLQAELDSKKNGNTIIMDIIGQAASAHAFITCAADKVNIRNGSSLMFHQAFAVDTYWGNNILVRDLVSDQEDIVLSKNMLNLCEANKELSLKDVEQIEKGRDVIISLLNNQLIKSYRSDDLSLLKFTVPYLVVKLTNLMTLVGTVYLIVLAIRKAWGKYK